MDAVDEMMESPVTGILMKILPWIDTENRDEMIASLTPEGQELIAHLYNIHRVNRTCD